MFKDLNGEALTVGATYTLIKDRTDKLMGVEFTMPHDFIYKGVDGIGNHQDQHEFVDGNGHALVFCPALPSHGVWRDYLQKK